jgi:hypothetical protein
MKKLLYISLCISSIAIQQAYGASAGFLGRCAQAMRCLLAREANQAPAARLQEQIAFEHAQTRRIEDAKSLLTPNVQQVLTGNDSVAAVSNLLQHSPDQEWPSAVISAIDRDLFYVLTKENGQAALKTIVEHNKNASNTIVERLNRIHYHAMFFLAHEHPQSFVFLYSQLCKTDRSKASIVSQLSGGGFPHSPELCERMVTFMADESHNPVVAERILKTFTFGHYVYFMQHAPIQTAQLLQNLQNYGGRRLKDMTLDRVMLAPQK